MIFRAILQNKGIGNELDAWLAFLCEDEPEMIEKLIQKYPYFRFLTMEDSHNLDEKDRGCGVF